MGNSDILYVNRLSNTVYKDGEILETVYAAKKTDTIKDTIFEIFSRILTRNGEQRKVLYHLMYDVAEYNKNSLSKHLKELYGKSDKTYTRAIDYLISRRIINVTCSQFSFYSRFYRRKLEYLSSKFSEYFTNSFFRNILMES